MQDVDSKPRALSSVACFHHEPLVSAEGLVALCRPEWRPLPRAERAPDSSPREGTEHRGSGSRQIRNLGPQPGTRGEALATLEVCPDPESGRGVLTALSSCSPVSARTSTSPPAT